MGATVCGADGCREIPNADYALLEGGAPADPPARPEPFVRVSIRIGVPDHVEALHLLFLPRSELVLADDGTTWTVPMGAGELQRWRGACSRSRRARCRRHARRRGRRGARSLPPEHAWRGAQPAAAAGRGERLRRVVARGAAAAIVLAAGAALGGAARRAQARRSRRAAAGAALAPVARGAEPHAAGRCTTSMVVHQPDEDAALVERARAGEPEAFARIVERHRARRFASPGCCAATPPTPRRRRRTPSSRRIARSAGFAPASPLRPWLLTIAANEARNRRRAAGRREHLALRAANEPPPRAAPSTESLAMAADRDAGLRAALARLGGADREVLWLRYFAELSEAETAVALGCRHGTVKSRTSRALARLRVELEGDDD